MKPTWILNGILFTQDARRSVKRSHLRIEDGRITTITGKKPSRIEKGAKVIDAKGLTILPGFVQAHMHLCQTLFRNLADDMELLDWLSKRIWVMEAAHTHATLYTSALAGIHELLASGTTCLLDMGTVRHTEAIFEAVQKTGIRANVGKCLMDHPETTPENLREDSESALKEAVDLFQRWNGKENDRIRASYAPRFVVSCTERLLRDVLTLSKRQNALIHTHASENLKEIQLVKRLVNCENVEYLHQLGLTGPHLVLAHCIWLKPNEKEILQQTKTHVVHCPSSNLKLASGLAHIPDLMKRGIEISLGADGAPCNNNLNMFQEMRLAALIHKPGAGPKAVRAQEVLDMATRNGAKALKWWDDIGSIEVGKKADLTALNLSDLTNFVPEKSVLDAEAIASSLVYSCGPSDVKFTMVDGNILYQNGRVTGLPKDRLIEQFKTAQNTIFKRVQTQISP